MKQPLEEPQFPAGDNQSSDIYKSPAVIKYPFWQMTAQNENAVYACINMCMAIAPDEIERQSICIDADIGTVLSELIV